MTALRNRYHRLTHVFVNDPTMGYGLYVEWMPEVCAKQTEAAERLLCRFCCTLAACCPV